MKEPTNDVIAGLYASTSDVNAANRAPGRTGRYMEYEGASKTCVQELNRIRPLGCIQRAEVRQPNRERQQRAVDRRKERRLPIPTSISPTILTNYNVIGTHDDTNQL